MSCGAKRDGRLDSLRLYCNLMLVVVHAYPFMYAARYCRGGEGEFWFWSFISMNFGLAIMSALFFLSGYLLFKGFSMEFYVRKMVSRVKKLIVPLFAWNSIMIVIYMGLFCVSPRTSAFVERVQLNSLWGVLQQLSPISNLADGPLWYLRAVFVFALLAPVWLLVFRYVHWALIVLTGAVVSCLYQGALTIYYPTYGISLFVVGGLLSYKGQDAVLFFRRYRVVLFPISLIALGGSFLHNYMVGSCIQPPDICRYLMLPLFWCFCDFIHEKLSVPFVLKWVAPASFTIYAGHFIVNSLCLHGLGVIIPAGAGKMSIIAIMTFVTGVVFCVILWHLLNRYLPSVCRVLDGRLK